MKRILVKIFFFPLINPRTRFTTMNNMKKYLKPGTAIKIANKNDRNITALTINCASIVFFVFTIFVLQLLHLF